MERVDTPGALTALVRDNVRALRAYQLQSHDAPIKLDQNENGLGTPGVIRDVLDERLRSLPLQRYPAPGQPRLRRAIAEAFQWTPEGVLVGNGSDQLLHTVARALLEPGRVVLSPTPSFFVYSQASLAQGATVVEVPLDADYRYDVEAFVRAVDEHAPHVVFLCSPNNPTGMGLSLDAIRRIATAAPGIVVLDEAYWEFAGRTARPLLDELPNLLLFRTFSKALGLAGIRVGYVLLQPELRAEVVKVQPPYPVNLMSTEAALVGLEHSDVAAAQARRLVTYRDALYQRLTGLAGVTVFPSETNFHLLRTRLGAKKTFEAFLRRGIVVRDVSAHPLLSECLRVSVGTEEENDAVYEALRGMTNDD